MSVGNIIKKYGTDFLIRFDAGVNDILQLTYASLMFEKASILHKICKDTWFFYFHYGKAVFHFTNKEDYLKGLLAIGEKCT